MTNNIYRNTTKPSLRSGQPHHKISPAKSIYDPEPVDPLAYAKKINNMGKVGLLLVIIIFNAIFWTMALNEYLLPADYYIHKDRQGDEIDPSN